MDLARHTAGILARTGLLATDLDGADLRTRAVPPRLDPGTLVRHIGAGHRRAEEIVRTRVAAFPDRTRLRVLDGGCPPGGSSSAPPASPGRSSRPGPTPRPATRSISAAARSAPAASPTRRWCTAPTPPSPPGSRPPPRRTSSPSRGTSGCAGALRAAPGRARLFGPGRTPAFGSTDTGARWFADLSGEVITRHRGPDAVTARAPLADLLLLVYRRKSLPDNTTAVPGDAALLDFRLGHGAFG